MIQLVKMNLMYFSNVHEMVMEKASQKKVVHKATKIGMSRVMGYVD